LKSEKNFVNVNNDLEVNRFMDSVISSSVLDCIKRNKPANIPEDRIHLDANLQTDLGFDSLGIAILATDLSGIIDFDSEVFAENLGEIRAVTDLIRIVEQARC